MSKFTKVLFFNFLLILAISFSGCGSSETTANKDAKPADNKAATTANKDAKPADNKPATTPETKTETASKGDKIGVPECDEYVEKYEACVFSKVPEAMRETFKSSFEQQRKAWKEAAANPQGKEALATGCKSALETAKKTLSAYSCEW